jgi:hypothetical protein
MAGSRQIHSPHRVSEAECNPRGGLREIYDAQYAHRGPCAIYPKGEQTGPNEGHADHELPHVGTPC